MSNSSDDEDLGEISRSAKRREALDVLRIAQALADLSEAELARVPLSDDLRAEVRRTSAVSQQIARKRQSQFLAKQLRKLDDTEMDAIRAVLDNKREHARVAATALHRVESWRDRLIASGDEALTEFLHQFPQTDSQQLRRLVRQARTEAERGTPPHAQRELFRTLREILPA